MKFKSLIAPFAVSALMLFSSSAGAVIVNFISLAEGPVGESAWSPLTVGILHVTGHATNDTPVDDLQQFAYLDRGLAGLGVCKDLTDNVFINVETNSGVNRCNPSNDDNVTDGEYLRFTFDQAVKVEKIYVNNNHDGGFGIDDDINVGVEGMGFTPFDAALGYAPGTGQAEDGVSIIASAIEVGVNQALLVAYNNTQFYISGLEYSVVPVPAAVWLFGSALAGLVGFGRRRQATVQA